MPRPTLHAEPMTATERSRARREREAARWQAVLRALADVTEAATVREARQIAADALAEVENAEAA